MNAQLQWDGPNKNWVYRFEDGNPYTFGAMLHVLEILTGAKAEIDTDMSTRKTAYFYFLRSGRRRFVCVVYQGSGEIKIVLDYYEYEIRDVLNALGNVSTYTVEGFEHMIPATIPGPEVRDGG